MQPQLGAVRSWPRRCGPPAPAGPATSAGTHPADRVHPGAVAAAARAGLDLEPCHAPMFIDRWTCRVGRDGVRPAHEELDPEPTWWHWSIPDPVEDGHRRGLRRRDRRTSTHRMPPRSSRIGGLHAIGTTTRIGINGFGRIGRLVVRALRRHPDLDLVHVNDPCADAATAAHLLEFDTVHGRFGGDGHRRRHDAARSTATGVAYSSIDHPATCRGSELGVDIVLECSASSRTTDTLAALSRRRRPQGDRRRPGQERRRARTSSWAATTTSTTRPGTTSSPRRRAPRTAWPRWSRCSTSSDRHRARR